MRVFVTGVAGFGPDGAGLAVRPGHVDDDVIAGALTLRGLRPLSRAARLAMAAAAQVLPPGSATGPRDAVVLASAYASVEPLADFVRVAAREGEENVFPMAFPNTVVSVHAGYVAALLGLAGPVVSPCGPHAGLEAVVEAFRLLTAGRADRALALGAEASGAVVGGARPGLGEAAGAVLLGRVPEPGGTRTVVTGCWTASSPESLPVDVGGAGVCSSDDGPDLGAARGVLAVARAVAQVATAGGSVTVTGRCGVRGVAAVRVEAVGTTPVG